MPKSFHRFMVAFVVIASTVVSIFVADASPASATSCSAKYATSYATSSGGVADTTYTVSTSNAAVGSSFNNDLAATYSYGSPSEGYSFIQYYVSGTTEFIATFFVQPSDTRTNLGWLTMQYC